MHRTCPLTVGGVPTRLPPCHRWQVANPTADPITVRLQSGTAVSGVVVTVAGNGVSPILLPPDGPVFVLIQPTVAAGGEAWILASLDTSAPPREV